jgi:predicted anti-sigma-YlaC factor YlaD
MNISCREVTRLLSEGLDKDLPPEEQARLRAHLAFCRGCQRLRERMEFLRRAMRKIVDQEDSGKS